MQFLIFTPRLNLKFILPQRPQGRGGNYEIQVYDMLGEKVYSGAISSANSEIDLSSKPSGVYLYRVITETGQLIGEGKLVIQ